MKYKSISAIMTTLFLITTIMFLGNCCGPKPPIRLDDEFTEMEKEFLAEKATYISQGSAAAIGRGRSERRDFALKNAKNDGRISLAQFFETKVENLIEIFIEELGEDLDTEINEAFSEASKLATKKTLKGTDPKKIGYLSERKENGETAIIAYVLMVEDLVTLNQSFKNELKNKNKKLYERFRASEAYKELDKAMEDYDAKSPK